MKTTTIILSSLQIPGTPDLLNHYIFVDPIYGTSFTYPNSASGSLFNSTTGTFVYPFTADGGQFFPWGYMVQNTAQSLTAGPFKGPYTVYFNPSAIDETYYSVLKIIYNFGDGTSQVVEKSIVDTTGTGDPTTTIVSHNYWATSQNGTTYSPFISVINGNLNINVFNIEFTIMPDSVYDFSDFHLIDSLQLSLSSNNLTVMETEDANYVTFLTQSISSS